MTSPRHRPFLRRSAARLSQAATVLGGAALVVALVAQRHFILQMDTVATSLFEARQELESATNLRRDSRVLHLEAVEGLLSGAESGAAFPARVQAQAARVQAEARAFAARPSGLAEEAHPKQALVAGVLAYTALLEDGAAVTDRVVRLSSLSKALEVIDAHSADVLEANSRRAAMEEAEADALRETFSWLRLASALLGILLTFAAILLRIWANEARRTQQAESNLRQQTELTQVLERRVHERTLELEETTTQLREIYRAMPEGVLTYSPDGTIETANALAESLLEYPCGELIGESILTLVQGVVAPPLATSGAWGSEVTRAEGICRTRSGQEIPVMLCTTSATSATGTRRMITIVVDLRERKELEGELLQAQKLESLGRLAAGVAHEINNPTAAIKSNLIYVEEELREGRISEDVLAAIGESRDAVRRISRIVSELKLSSRFAATPVELRPTSLLRVIESTLGLLSEQAHGAEIRVEVPAGLTVRSDDVGLGQVLTNLVTNALQAAGSRRPRVTIRAARRGEGEVRLEVEDAGCGMTEEVRNRIFDPFFTTKPVGQGTGLGLSVIRGILTHLSGRISVESKLGVGSRFTVDLPGGDEPPSAAFESRAVAHAPPSKPLVLVVDDDLLVVSALRRQLSSQFEVRTALSVAEAVHELTLRQPHLILCDVIMPDGGAKRLTQELEHRWPGLSQRVILISGGTTSEEQLRFVESSAAPLVPKPVSRTRLDAAFRALDAKPAALSVH